MKFHRHVLAIVDLRSWNSLRGGSAAARLRIVPTMKATSCLRERKRVASPDATTSTRPRRRLRSPAIGSNWITKARSVALRSGPLDCLLIGFGGIARRYWKSLEFG
jgi:hypothetical protein